jgi:hypothetical protein
MKLLVYWIRRTIRVLIAPQHEISMSLPIWESLVAELERRGNGVRESGAFLLGGIRRGRREVVSFVLYDDLEPGCLDTGAINFTSTGYRKLWKHLKETNLQVIADIHTHPRAAIQSGIDRANPMMPNAGHLAFILPNYATGEPTPAEAAIYQFLGSQQWKAYPSGESSKNFYVGNWS